MSIAARIAPAITITGSSLLVSCGGGYGGSCGSYGSYGSYGSCGALYPGPDGIYEGAVGSTTGPASPVVAIIADDGQGRIATQDGHYYRLNVRASGNSLGGSFSSISQAAVSPGNGAATPSGSVEGQMTPTGLNLTLTDAMSPPQPLTLQFDDVYGQRSALAYLGGVWTATSNGLTLTATIQADGSFSAADSNNCTYSGSFSLIRSAFNVYAESHIRSCNGIATPFDGLASLLPANSTSGASTQLRLLTDNGTNESLSADFQ